VQGFLVKSAGVTHRIQVNTGTVEMSVEGNFRNRVRGYRLARQWSQLELARRANISRAAVSAIESERLVPSVAAALCLARTLECSVEELFGNLPGGGEGSSYQPQWAWRPPTPNSRFWAARIGTQRLLFPVEPTPLGMLASDGRADGKPPVVNERLAEMTLVVASCDPAIGMLARLYEQVTGFRMLAFCRASQTALELLQRNLVHVAGLHVATPSQPDKNRTASQGVCGSETRLIRVATWEAGVALSDKLAGKSVASLVKQSPRWIGREVGSGARHCQEELWTGRPEPERIARDHRGVAEAIRWGWADVGVCLRLVAEEAGLDFLSVRSEYYDLCFLAEQEQDPRILALIRVLQSVSYRRLLADLPGYDTASTGLIG
jgi:molybdate-binding protein/DNA-binding XRE family transcriptional regulator